MRDEPGCTILKTSTDMVLSRRSTIASRVDRLVKRRRKPKNANTRKSADTGTTLQRRTAFNGDRDRLCSDCRRLDLKAIFGCGSAGDITSGFFSTLGKIRMKNPGTCSLCALFASSGSAELAAGEIVRVYSGRLSKEYGYEEIPPNIDTTTVWVTRYSGRAFNRAFVLPTRCVRSQKANDCHASSAGGICPHILARETQPDVIDYPLIRGWLGICSSAHDTCVNKHLSLDFSDMPGFCLIDCSTRRVIPAAQASESTYATLSYVWGPASNLNSLDMTDLLPHKLPLVAEDAIIVAQNLGYKYLWVDRYCIPRDGSMKHVQVQNMGKIYSRSALTIIAAAGKNAEYGLPGVSLRMRIPQSRLSLGNGKIQLALVRAATYDINISKWNSRGWTYQEAMLSKRRLVFTDHHVYFECQDTFTSDDIRLPPGVLLRAQWEPCNIPFPFPSLGSGDMEDDYKQIWATITDYSNRELTYNCDALDAIAGVFKKFSVPHVRLLCGLPIFLHPDIPPGHDFLLTQRDEGLESLDGMPCEGMFSRRYLDTSTLMHALLWEDRWTERDEPSHNSSYCPRRREFPSWTWAGWKHTKNHKVKYHSPPDPLWSCANRRRGRHARQFLQCSMSVSFGDTRLEWPEASDKILALSEEGMIPSGLTIKGLVCDSDQGNGTDDSTPNSIHAKWNCESCETACPRPLPEESNKFIELFLTVRTETISSRSSGTDEERWKFESLLLRPIGKGANGTVYERVGVIQTSVSKRKNGNKDDPLGSLHSERVGNYRSMEVTIR
ncbi:heterokaryon incompatibility protein-domain-containing protein [Sordaria brevicollis]|uniref:Heterokaryon incompatibility protein-domain-containing protein n=1 Tax=Sordaria brevicollis TaxID=83679 RepID=A0AAE0PKB5_SORBR|nr:heterokaryon incompatibility protein-domain-containing protein [Sordaria brevicollis]